MSKQKMVYAVAYMDDYGGGAIDSVYQMESMAAERAAKLNKRDISGWGVYEIPYYPEPIGNYF